MKTEQPQPNCNKDAQSIFEHNKGIFHLGQCPDCFQSNVINPKPPQEAFTRQDFIKLLEAPTPTRMTPTAQDIEQWKKEAEAEYPHDEKDGYLYNDFQDSSREGFVAGRQKSFEEYWKRIEMMEKIVLNESRLVQLEIELRNDLQTLQQENELLKSVNANLRNVLTPLEASLRQMTEERNHADDVIKKMHAYSKNPTELREREFEEAMEKYSSLITASSSLALDAKKVKE